MAKRQSTLASLIFLLLMTGIFLLPWLFYRPKPPPPVPEEKVAEMFKKAEELEKDKTGLRLNDAINIYEEIVKKYPLSEKAPYAILKLGEIYEKKLMDTKKASAYYTRLEQAPYRDKLLEIEENGQKIVLPANEVALRKLDEINRDAVLYKFMDFLVRLLGKNPSYSYVLVLVLLVILVRLPLLPITNAQFRYMKKMQEIQPLLLEVQRKYRNDPRKLQKETARIFREEKVNPFGGCLLSIIQFPIFFVPYFMIRLYAYQFNKVGFLWIKSLAQPDIPLFIIYVISLFVSMWLTSPSDPQQKQQSMMMSIMMLFFFIMFFRFLPSAFIFYWLLLNIATTIQQWIITRKPKTIPQKVS
ncbi:membrane protein insertase YidC [bacterium]|nr:membrane protein insertase YidC [bacterium]